MARFLDIGTINGIGSSATVPPEQSWQTSEAGELFHRALITNGKSASILAPAMISV
jgi:hypothetical protein